MADDLAVVLSGTCGDRPGPTRGAIPPGLVPLAIGIIAILGLLDALGALSGSGRSRAAPRLQSSPAGRRRGPELALVETGNDRALAIACSP